MWPGAVRALTAVQFQEERLWAVATNLRTFETVIADAMQYTGLRKTFGKPVVANQYVQFRFAELQTEVGARARACARVVMAAGGAAAQPV